MGIRGESSEGETTTSFGSAALPSCWVEGGQPERGIGLVQWEGQCECKGSCSGRGSDVIGGILHCARQCSGWLCSGRGHALGEDSAMERGHALRGDSVLRCHALGGTVQWEGSRIGRGQCSERS